MYKLSEASARDIENILERSLLEFGQTQTEQYYQSLKNCLELLAGNPEVGNTADEIQSGYHRFPHQSHVIFYTISESDIFVALILHKSMDMPARLDE